MKIRWIVFIVLFIALFSVLGCCYNMLSSDEALMAKWADRELACLIEPLDRFYQEFGCYPQHLCGPRSVVHETYVNYKSLPNCSDFPKPSTNFGHFEYLEMDLDDYLLGVSLRLKKNPWDPSCGNWEDMAILTSAKGCIKKFPPFLSAKFSFFKSMEYMGSQGQWSFWSPAFPRSPYPPGGGKALGDFILGLWHENPSIRVAAAAALSDQHCEETVEYLIGAISDTSPKVRAKATWALGRVGGKKAFNVLKEAISDPEPAVQERAVWAMEEIEKRIKQKDKYRTSGRSTAFKDWCDFEHADVNEYPGVSGWLPLSRGGEAVVTDAKAHVGRHSFKIKSRSDKVRGEYKRLSTSQLPECITYEIAILSDPVPGRKVQIGFLDGFGKGFRFYNRFHIESAEGNKGRIEFAGSQEASIDLGTFNIDEWITLKAELDFTEKRGKLWVNSKEVAADVPIFPQSFTDGERGRVRLLRWGFSETEWQGDSQGVIYVDSYKMNGAPRESKK